MSEVRTDLTAFEAFMEQNIVPDEAIAVDFSASRLTNALSFMRGVELYWADHIEWPREDYPDEFTDEEWGKICKENVVHAGHINKTWAKLLAGDFQIITTLDELEQADKTNHGMRPEKSRLKLVEDPLEVGGRKSDKFTERIVPLLNHTASLI